MLVDNDVFEKAEARAKDATLPLCGCESDSPRTIIEVLIPAAPALVPARTIFVVLHTMSQLVREIGPAKDRDEPHLIAARHKNAGHAVKQVIGIRLEHILTRSRRKTRGFATPRFLKACV